MQASQHSLDAGLAPSARGARALRWALVLLPLVAVSAWLALSARRADGLAGMAVELRDRGKVAVVGDDSLLGTDVDGTLLVPVSTMPPLARALAGSSIDAVRDAMRASWVRALLVDTTSPATQPRGSVARRLATYESMPDLPGVFLAPAAALYELGERPRLDDAERAALGHVTRRILMGARPPAFASFPAAMRREMGIEMLVVVRDGRTALLWRSARRGSVARGVVDASIAARDRWDVRASFLGGPIEQRLPSLTVELIAILHDGRLAARSAEFLARVLRPGLHGVGYERRGDWRYVLPEIAAAAGRRHPIGMVEALLRDNGMPASDVDRPELTFYRFTLMPLSTSAPERPSRPGHASPPPVPPRPPPVPPSLVRER